MPPTSPQQPAASALDQPLQTVALVPSATSAAPPTACQYKPETSLNWEEQFVDLTSYCNSHIQMALIPDEGFADSSLATEQRNGPDVFFGSDVASGSGLVDMLDTPSSFDSFLYKGASSKFEGNGVVGAVSKGMPGLKLNVDIENQVEADLMNTPDVIKAFDDVDSFDLIDYVFNQDKKPVLLELDKPFDDHSDTYTAQETTLALLLNKPTPTPAPTKTPPETKNPLSANSSIGNTANTQNTLRSGKGLVNKPKQIATIRPKRIKQKKMFDDFVYETLSPVTVKQEESECETPSLVTSTVKKKLLTLPARKRNISCSSTSSSTFSTTKKRRLTDDEDVLEYESGKYRELRNRNNEASRRSRANRKQREQKMKEYSDRLIADNVRLKSKAENMERQVEKFRNCLMKIVLSMKQR
uniref:BZIP domain-containing protein n=1 Tax=Cacopsylla melanoneura TaxID=428564 RepID=A0A8D8XQE8_9HEMI